jgi:single-strand DNA-binding protein
MKSLNKVTLIGHLGDAPEFNTIEGNIPFAKFSIATNDLYKDKSGQVHTETEWHTIILWRSLAELATKYLVKGSFVYIEGKLKTRTWEDKAGVKKSATEIIAEHLIMLDKKEG